MNDETQRKIGVLLSYVVIGLNIAISVFYTPILTSKLGQSEYGLYSMVSSIISSLTILDFGFSSAIIIYSNKYRERKEFEKEHNLYGMFISLYTIVGIIVSLVGVFLYLNVETLFGSTMTVAEIETAKKLMLILTFNLATTFPLSVFSSIIIAYEKFIFAKLINIATIILQPLTMLILLNFGCKSVALAIVITVLNLLTALFNCLYCKWHIKTKIKFNYIDFKLLLEIFAFSFWIFLNEVIDKVNWSLDNFLIGAISGTVAVSVYAIAAQINHLYMSFSTAISGVLQPKVTKMVERGATDEELTDLVIKTGRIQLMVVGIILGGFAVFGRYFINLWVGDSYQGAYYMALALMTPLIISLIQNSAAPIVRAKNKHKFLPIVLIFTSILNVILSIPLIRLYQGLGAALGTGISLFIANIVLKNIYYYKKVHIDVIKFFKKVMNIAIAILLETIVFLIGFSLFHINLTSWISLILGIFIYLIIYGILSIFFLNQDEKNMIKKAYLTIKRKTRLG